MTSRNCRKDFGWEVHSCCSGDVGRGCAECRSAARSPLPPGTRTGAGAQPCAGTLPGRTTGSGRGFPKWGQCHVLSLSPGWDRSFQT